MPKSPPAASAQITLYVCRSCDTNPSKMETPEARKGRTFLRLLRKALASQADITLRPITCLGGCEHSGTPNGCCSVGLAATGRYSYVLNKLQPTTDVWKVLEFLRLYRKAPQGIIRSKNSPHAEYLRPHIATRVPPPK